MEFSELKHAVLDIFTDYSNEMKQTIEKLTIENEALRMEIRRLNGKKVDMSPQKDKMRSVIKFSDVPMDLINDGLLKQHGTFSGGFVEHMVGLH